MHQKKDKKKFSICFASYCRLKAATHQKFFTLPTMSSSSSSESALQQLRSFTADIDTAYAATTKPEWAAPENKTVDLVTLHRSVLGLSRELMCTIETLTHFVEACPLPPSSASNMKTMRELYHMALGRNNCDRQLKTCLGVESEDNAALIKAVIEQCDKFRKMHDEAFVIQSTVLVDVLLQWQAVVALLRDVLGRSNALYIAHEAAVKRVLDSAPLVADLWSIHAHRCTLYPLLEQCVVSAADEATREQARLGKGGGNKRSLAQAIEDVQRHQRELDFLRSVKPILMWRATNNLDAYSLYCILTANTLFVNHARFLLFMSPLSDVARVLSALGVAFPENSDQTLLFSVPIQRLVLAMSAANKRLIECAIQASPLFRGVDTTSVANSDDSGGGGGAAAAARYTNGGHATTDTPPQQYSAYP